MQPIKLNSEQFWQTTPLDFAIAEEFFGWRWLTHVGIPTRSAPNYPEKRPVRRFFPPDSELNKQWFAHFERVPHEPSKGDEPLCYCYCSSNGPHLVPHFSGHANAIQKLEAEIERRGIMDDYLGQLAAQAGCEVEETAKLMRATCEQRCIAALAVIGSKYVTMEQPQ